MPHPIDSPMSLHEICAMLFFGLTCGLMGYVIGWTKGRLSAALKVVQQLCELERRIGKPSVNAHPRPPGTEVGFFLP